MSIQYPAPGLELTTSWMPDSSHNHWNRPPPLEHSLSKLIPLSFTHSLALLIFECLWLIKIPFGQRREKIIWAVFVAQLVEQLLAIPEICGSDPVIGKPLYRTFVYCQLYWKDESSEKDAVNGPFKKIMRKNSRLQWSEFESRWSLQFFL